MQNPNDIPFNGIVRPEWIEPSPTSIDPDYERLQGAIDIATQTGSKVLLAPKVYVIHHTLHIYTGTIIEGTIWGAFDRSAFTGSMISYSGIDNERGTGTAILCKCYNSDDSKLTCYRFRLANFSIFHGFDPDDPTKEESVSNTAVGLSFETETHETAPRNGEIENIKIKDFGTGIRIKGISYVNFKSIDISDFTTGILIEKNISNHYIEFARFDKIMLGTRFSGSYDTVGILLKDGNFVYFNQIDINDCRTGFLADSKYKLFSIFLNEIHIARANTCLYIYPHNSHITRFSVSDITLSYSASEEPAHLGTTNYGLRFYRASNYTLGDSSFDRITDSNDYNVAGRTHYFIHISGGDNLESCRFSNLRVLNKVFGISGLRRFQILNAKPWGQTYVTRGNHTDVEILSRDVFNSNYPMVITTTDGSTYAEAPSQFFVGSTGNLILRISMPSSSVTTRLVKFIIPLLV